MKKSILALVLALSATAGLASEYSCFGTEPFWGAKITKSELMVDDFENQSSEVITSKNTAIGVGEEYVFVVKTKNKSMTVVTGECSDGMSDTIYSHHAVLDLGNNKVFYGCCNVQKK